MISFLDTLKKAAKTEAKKSNQPDASSVIKALLDAEKTAKKEKVVYSFDRLIGTWNLSFVSGIKKVREKSVVVLGSGKYIPKLIGINILYIQDQEQSINTGRVRNSVELGFLNLYLTGPIKFIEPKNILAFDFTQMAISIFGFKIYQGYIREGKARENDFYQGKLSEQAFFSYFLIEDNLIAARGKGGGLALWCRGDKKIN